MSILNIRLRGDYALIAVDAGGVGPDGSTQELSKLAPVIHIPAVIAYRGTSAFMPLVFMRCVMRAGRNMESLLDDVPTILPAAFEQLLAWQAQGLPQHPDIPIDKQAIAIVGWSQKQGRMICRAYEQEDRATGFVSEDISERVLVPWDDSIPARLADVLVPKDMEPLARAQVSAMRRESAVLATGGRLMVARIDRSGSISIRPQCDLDSEPAATIAGSMPAGAAVMAASFQRAPGGRRII